MADARASYIHTLNVPKWEQIKGGGIGFSMKMLENQGNQGFFIKEIRDLLQENSVLDHFNRF